MSSVSLAFVNTTGEVTLVLNTDVSLATSFTESMHIIDVTSLEVHPETGWTYDGNDFVAPPVIIEPPTDNTIPPVADNPNTTE